MLTILFCSFVWRTTVRPYPPIRLNGTLIYVYVNYKEARRYEIYVSLLPIDHPGQRICYIYIPFPLKHVPCTIPAAIPFKACIPKSFSTRCNKLPVQEYLVFKGSDSDIWAKPKMRCATQPIVNVIEQAQIPRGLTTKMQIARYLQGACACVYLHIYIYIYI